MREKVSDGGTTSGNFTYLYDGTKLRATNGAGDGFDYLGSLVYNKNGANSTLESAAFGAGRIVKTSTGYDVRYFITDHLGSVRASINQAGQVSDRSDYQLLGERWSGAGIEATTNRYQFNGKERQMVLAAANGADAGALDGSHLLDYGARNYDPNIGRWFTPDPLAEKYNSMSPYLYCAANPIKFIDPDGRQVADFYDRKGSYLGTDGVKDARMFVLKENSKLNKDNLAVNQQGVLDEKQVDNLVANSEEITSDSDIGVVTRAVYAEMRGEDSDSKAVVAESVVNRANLPDGAYEKADGTIKGIVAKAYDVAKAKSSQNKYYENPKSFIYSNPIDLKAWRQSGSAAINAVIGGSNVGKGVIFYNSSNATYFDSNSKLQKILITPKPSGIAGAWKLK